MSNPFRAGLDVDHLTEADLLLANPETHTHPYGSHPLLPIHEGHDLPHSHPPFNDPPVIDLHSPGTSWRSAVGRKQRNSFLIQPVPFIAPD